MSDNWQTYLTNVNGELASIRFDLRPAEPVPDAARPWLHWVWVEFRAPRRDGLSSGEEATRLWEIEHALVAGCASACGAAHVGCITTQRRREFYFYAADEEGFEATVSRVMRSFPEYKGKFECGSQHEPDWNQYRNVLHPSENQMDSIANRQVLDSMVRMGDIHERERMVTHFVYFAGKAERTRFMDAAQAADFVLVETIDKEERGKSRWGVMLRRPQGITQQQIDATTRELRGLARTSKGEYDGWEAEVVTH